MTQIAKKRDTDVFDLPIISMSALPMRKLYKKSFNLFLVGKGLI